MKIKKYKFAQKNKKVIYNHSLFTLNIPVTRIFISFIQSKLNIIYFSSTISNSELNINQHKINLETGYFYKLWLVDIKIVHLNFWYTNGFKRTYFY